MLGSSVLWIIQNSDARARARARARRGARAPCRILRTLRTLRALRTVCGAPAHPAESCAPCRILRTLPNPAHCLRSPSRAESC